MKILLASDLNRDNLYVEIYEGDEQWAEVTYDEINQKFHLQIFAPSSGNSYKFDLAEVQEILTKAKYRLGVEEPQTPKV